MYGFYSDCVSWPKSKVDDLIEMVDNALEITPKTLMKHIDSSGYEEMIKDCCTSCYRSKLYGKRVYFFQWSAIEYVFTN